MHPRDLVACNENEGMSMHSHNLDDINSIATPHTQAMVKFDVRFLRFPNGFDFTVPLYRKGVFEEAVTRRKLVFEEIAESEVVLCERRLSLFERIKSGNFKREKIINFEGVGLTDLVTADFVSITSAFYLMLYGKATRTCICYSIAPTQELLDKRELAR